MKGELYRRGFLAGAAVVAGLGTVTQAATTQAPPPVHLGERPAADARSAGSLSAGTCRRGDQPDRGTRCKDQRRGGARLHRARTAADAADAALARGEQRPLLGLPMTVKEQYNVTGLPTCWGLERFRNWRPISICSRSSG